MRNQHFIGRNGKYPFKKLIFSSTLGIDTDPDNISNNTNHLLSYNTEFSKVKNKQ